MTLSDWLRQATKTLEDAGIGTARLDCLVLLEDAAGKDRSWLLANQEHILQGATLNRLKQQLNRRVEHEPLAYIRERCEFYGREFFVDKRVLVPRPESETMITILKDLYKYRAIARYLYTIVDIGTGSGALGITAKLEVPDAEVTLIDIDPKCLEVAKNNAKKHNVNVGFLKGNLLEPLIDSKPQTTNSILLCNLPYVPDSYTVNEAAKTEPKIAIYGGEDGLHLYRELFYQIAKNLQFDSLKYVLTESLPFQHEDLRKIAKNASYKQVQESDFIQVFEYTKL